MAGTYFIRSCPTCGRALEIRVELLNRKVECSHCHANFVATESEERSISDLRIEQALARAQKYLASIPVDAASREVG
jgi:DNA-directed RNA polymerase subunit M/transcription elongation factor TFIIS